jgi:uncharacterized protein YebE (UPF0316 family)
MQNLTCIYNYIAYSTGFALGVYIGMFIESKLAMGMVVVRIITHQDAGLLVHDLREENCGVTVMQGHGSSGYVNIIFTIVKRSSLKEITPIIERHNPAAFYSVEDIRLVNQGIFPGKHSHSIFSKKRGFGSNGMRKGK